MAVRRSLLSRYASIRRPSVVSGGGSSTLSSVARKQYSAEDAIIDNQYETGNLSAENYLMKLGERISRTWITPLQAQTLKEKIESVKTDVVDAEYNRLYQTGELKTKDLYTYEKSKLDKMTEPGSEAYIKQQQKVQGLLDKSEREDRTDFRRNEMLRISQMPEDSSDRMWEKARLYDQLEQQARLDGDIEQADSLATQKNTYVSSAKRGDINDLITGTKLQVSETFGAGSGVPSAEGGSKLYGELTGTTGFSGTLTPAVKNSLESLDRQKKSLDRLYQNKSDKEALISTYEQAVNAATGDQKTQLTIALNNLKSDIVSIDDQIGNTTQNITDTVYRVQEQIQKAAAAAFNQEVRKNNREFDKAETGLEEEFRKGNISKIEYVAKGIELAQDKAMFSDQVSSVYGQYGNDASADSYLQKSEDALRIHEQLVSVAQNIDDYEPLFIDKDSPLSNLLGKKVSRGDVVLTDVRQLKDNGQWDQNYVLDSGVFHRVYYPKEYSDESGYLISGISAKELAQLRDTAYIYKKDDSGAMIQDKINFVQFTDENNNPIMKPVAQSSVDKMLKTGVVINDPKKGLIQAPQLKEPGVLLKAGAAVQEFAEKNLPGVKKVREAFDAAKEVSPFAPFKRTAAFYGTLLENPKQLFQEFKDFASKAVSKTKEVFRGMNIFNPPEVISKTNEGEYKFVSGTPNEYKQDIITASQQTGIPTDVLSSLLKSESGFNPNAISPAGAIGIAQIMPATARELGVDPNDPSQAILGAAKYLRKNLDATGDMKLALAAYNAGLGAVRGAGNKIPPYKETQNYVKKVLQNLGQTVTHFFSPESEAKDYTTDQLPDPRRTRNVELALGLQPGQYRKGLKQDQGAVDRAFRSNDPTMTQLLKEEGFKPSWEAAQPIQTPRPSATPAPRQSTPSFSMPKIEIPKFNIPQVQLPKINLQPTIKKVQSYVQPAISKAQSYVQPIVQKAQQAVSSVKSWVSNLFKRK